MSDFFTTLVNIAKRLNHWREHIVSLQVQDMSLNQIFKKENDEH